MSPTLHRLARVASVVWLIVCFMEYFGGAYPHAYPRWGKFFFFGVVPLALVWGIALGPTMFILFSAFIGLLGWLIWPWFFMGLGGRSLVIIMLLGTLFGLGRAAFRRGLS